MMHIGLIMAGEVPEELSANHLTYEEMIMRFIRRANNDVYFTVYPVQHGEIPSNPTECDGWVISGSRCAVYEDHPWIPAIVSFCQSAAGKTRTFGICFGHQLMAMAFGGNVALDKKGWSAGLHQYRGNGDSKYFKGVDTFRGYAMHRDQVTKAPANSQAIFSADLCAIAGLEYDNWGLSLQCHPEFERVYESDLISHLLSQKLMTSAEASLARANLDGEPDNQAISERIMNFFSNKA